MAEKKIYIQFWSADRGAYEWREFSTGEIDELMDLGIIDEDTLGYAMDDHDAFDQAMEALEKSGEAWSYGRFVAEYLSRTDHEIRTEA